MIQVFAGITRAKKESHVAEVLDFIARYNEYNGRHAHLEYDYSYHTYRMAGNVAFADDESSLSSAMVRGMVLRCLNGMNEVADALKAVEAGKLDVEGGLSALVSKREGAGDGAEGSDTSETKGVASTLPDKGGNTQTGEGNMRLTSAVTQWLKDQEWEDEPEIDEENQTSSTGFSYGMDDFSLNCWVEVAEKTGFVKVYMYFGEPNTPSNRADEVQRFCNEATNRIVVGKLQFRPEQRDIRYFAAMDFENATCESAHIANLFNSGVAVLGIYLPKYMAICFGGKTAEEALEMED